MFSMGNKADVIKLRGFRIKIIATINGPTGHKVIRSARGIP